LGKLLLKMIIDNPEVEILPPVHNEGERIEIGTRDLHAGISPKVAIRFLAGEDASGENTIPNTPKPWQEHEPIWETSAQALTSSPPNT